MTDVYGYNDWLGIDLEDGTDEIASRMPVLGTVGIDVMSTNFGQNVNNIFQRSMRQEGRIPQRIIPRLSDLTGDISLEVPVVNAGMILEAVFGGGASAASGSEYIWTWLDKTSPAINTLTLAQRINDYHRLTGNVAVAKMNLRAAIDQPLTMGLSPLGIDCAYQDKTVADGGTFTPEGNWIGAAGLAYDSSYEDFHVAIQYNGSDTDLIDDFNFEHSTGVKHKRALTGSRRPVGFQYGKSESTLSLAMYFSSDAERRRIMGDTGSAYPYKLTENAPSSVSAILQAQRTISSVVYYFKVTLPKLYLAAPPGDAEYIEDVVKVPITLKPVYDSSTGSGIKIEVRTTVAPVATAYPCGTAVDSADLPTDFGASTYTTRKI